ncbi:hypothetical protein C2R22_00385 [Salinigranum rubrum]|uniref:Uncharacterized protein n=1 Tax=Salinigranum rubrum TaxID=755307 RepID=A0A2I8VPK0_9EURY|nr:DUF2270 domain-containing protein [Salinigranum rubrum]AUV83825.1 hypothetical protein C2R22_00385 [Salinigranum rubrum]
MIDSEVADGILDDLSTYEYASERHVCFLLIWRAPLRRGATHALDVDDYDPQEVSLDVRHHPETGTPIKNKRDGERFIDLSEETHPSHTIQPSYTSLWYDVYRSRIRMLQQNLFANALDPSQGTEHPDWRVELSNDYRTPKLKVTFREALANRLRRVYLALFGVLLAAWIFRITVTPRQDWLTTAAIAAAPGSVVVGVVATFSVTVLGIAIWPHKRQAKGESREGDPETWNED